MRNDKQSSAGAWQQHAAFMVPLLCNLFFLTRAARTLPQCTITSPIPHSELCRLLCCRLLRNSAAHESNLVDQRLEAVRLKHRQLAQHLAVDVDVLGLQAMDELGVWYLQGAHCLLLQARIRWA